MATFRDPDVARMATFLMAIGIGIGIGETPPDAFLPGIAVSGGVLVVDEERLTYPGDLLHEAGHLALMTTESRREARGNFGDDAGYETGAIAWSWAAALHIHLSPEIVFHGGGYRGGSVAILDNFSAGRYVGVPILEWLGMAAGPKRAAELGVEAYPAMLRWLRE